MSDTIKNAADFVRYILEQLCEHKDQINVEANRDDLGILIGARDSERVNLKVLEPNQD